MTVGGSIISTQKALGSEGKVTGLQPGNKTISSTVPGFLIQAPLLTSLDDDPQTVICSKPFLLMLVLVSVVSQQWKANQE